MSVRTESRLICDWCQSESASHSAVRWTRYYAKQAGWIQRKIDGKWIDICDACVDQQEETECRDALAQAASA